MNQNVFFHKLTSARLKEFRDNGAVMLISFGSVEQHSSHLPVGTDFLCSEKRVEAIAIQTESIVFLPMALGYSFNHANMFGTVSLSAETMLKVVVEILEQLCEQGWKRYVIFSGHAGNWSVLELAVQKIRERFPLVQIILARGIPAPSDPAQNMNRLKNLDLHAGKIETALISYYYPELLDAKNIPDGNNALPDYIYRHIRSANFDEFDELLLKACVPQNTELISRHGNWGIDSPNNYQEVPVKDAMKSYEDFFVKLITRWKSWENK